MLLTPNRWSRPGKKITAVKGLVIHYTASPNGTAVAVRNYFESLKSGTNPDRFASSHYIVGLNGEIVQCLPEDEIAYHAGSNTYTQECKDRLAGSPNYHTLGIETCHPSTDGHFNEATIDSLIKLSADICKRYDLNPLTDLWTHKEVVGWKDCPLWFVKNPVEWQNFKKKVDLVLNPPKPVDPNAWKYVALQELCDAGIVQDYEGWKAKIDENAPNWLVFILMNKIRKAGK